MRHSSVQIRGGAPDYQNYLCSCNNVPALIYGALRADFFEVLAVERPFPSVIAHCDWGSDRKKRWMAVASRAGNYWSLGAPEVVSDTADLFDRLRLRAQSAGSLLIGFDFPIGLPLPYGHRTGLRDFRDALEHFGSDVWSDWYSVCEQKSEISIKRPFYPMRPGGTKRSHLLSGLGFESISQILRQCEKAHDGRPDACSLFWTLGGNQVGKGAIAGWRELIVPNLEQIAIWPFDGPLFDLLKSREITIAETYPGDVYGQLGIPRSPRWSKRKKEGRIVVAPHLLRWLAKNIPNLDGETSALVANGFSDGPDGEDQFDAMVGLFGMLDVVDGRRPEDSPRDNAVLKWEGWIMGQSSNTG